MLYEPRGGLIIISYIYIYNFRYISNLDMPKDKEILDRKYMPIWGILVPFYGT